MAQRGSGIGKMLSLLIAATAWVSIMPSVISQLLNATIWAFLAGTIFYNIFMVLIPLLVTFGGLYLMADIAGIKIA